MTQGATVFAVKCFEGPSLCVPDNGVEDDEELSCCRNDGEQLWLSGGGQLFAEGLEDRIVSRGDRGAHKKHGAHACPAADEAFTGPLAGLPRPRRQADERGDLAPVKRSQFG